MRDQALSIAARVAPPAVAENNKLESPGACRPEAGLARSTDVLAVDTDAVHVVRVGSQFGEVGLVLRIVRQETRVGPVEGLACCCHEAEVHAIGAISHVAYAGFERSPEDRRSIISEILNVRKP